MGFDALFSLFTLERLLYDAAVGELTRDGIVVRVETDWAFTQAAAGDQWLGESAASEATDADEVMLDCLSSETLRRTRWLFTGT